jgi:hypothetical protein
MVPANLVKRTRMTVVVKGSPLYRRPEEIGRRVVGSLLELGIKAYGAAAAVSVALSDSDTAGGKSYDALNAVPNLMERYREAKYVVDHREEIQTAVEYVHQHAPDPDQLETAARQSSETLERITTTYDEVTQAWNAFAGIRPNNVIHNLPRAKEHFDKAWAAKPGLDSISDLAHEAQDVTPFLRQLRGLDIDFPRLYANLLSVLDNFASDEIAATLGVMGAALGLAYILGMGAGFWGRRGRPGFIAGTLQRLGAHFFRGWYVRNLEYALGRSVYDVARERIQRDIVADPHKALDPQALEELERYFERRLRQKPTLSSASVTATRPRT